MTDRPPDDPAQVTIAGARVEVGRIRFDRFSFDRDSQLLSRDGQEVPLPPRGVALLALLLDRAGQLVRKDEILDIVWKGAFVSETAIAEAVSQLRQALGDAAADPRFIQTIHRRGYRFIAPVEAVTMGVVPPAPERPGGVSPPHPGATSPARPGWPTAGLWPPRLALAAGIGAVMTVTAVGLARFGPWAGAGDDPSPPPAAPVRFDLQIPAEVRAVDALAWSPDDTRLAFVGRGADGSRIYLRALDRPSIEPLADTEGATEPFFSADGGSLGYFQQGRLWVRSMTPGGVAQPLCDAADPTSAAWHPRHGIVFAAGAPRALWQVDSAGGTPRRLIDSTAFPGAVAVDDPAFLPGQPRLAFTVWRHSIADATIETIDLNTLATAPLLAGAARPTAAGEFLYFVRADGLYRDRLRAGRMEGREERSPEALRIMPLAGPTAFAVSPGGALAHLQAVQSPPPVELLWLDGTGRENTGGRRAALERPDWLARLRLSPRGERAVAVLLDPAAEVWVYELATGTRTRLTRGGFHAGPIWTPDGRRVCYQSREGSNFRVVCQAADGASPAETLFAPVAPVGLSSFSPDGASLLFATSGEGTGIDLWRYSLSARRAEPLLVTPADEFEAMVGPDGRHFLYVSTESGRDEVYLDTFPTPSRRTRVSRDGGESPAWGDGGRRIVYSRGDRVFAARFDPPSRRLTPSEPVFESQAILEALPHPLSPAILVARRPPRWIQRSAIRVVLPALPAPRR